MAIISGVIGKFCKQILKLVSSKLSGIGDKEMKTTREIYRIYNHNIHHGNRFQMEWLRIIRQFSGG